MMGIFGTLAASETSSGFLTAWDFLYKGGIFMVPLALTSVVGAMAILYKALSLAGPRVLPPRLAHEIAAFHHRVVADKAEPVIAEIEKGRSVLARLSAVVLRHRGKPRAEITHSVESAARVEIVHLHAGIAVIDTIITIAPLLGLLGTASGLVTVFQHLGENNDHLAIARGIAEALTTTIVGLAIAVPCVVAHGYFIRRIEMLTAQLESLLADLAAFCERPTTPNA